MEPIPFEKLEAEMSTEAITKSDVKAKRILAQIRLQEMRKQRGITQEETARRLNVQQSYISKLESKPDMSLSKFRQYVDALGGSVELIVHFPNDDPLHIPL